MPKRKTTRKKFKRLGLAAGMAAALALAFLGGWYHGPTPASAMELVREAKRVHNLPLERGYVVDIERVVSDDAQTSLEKVPREVRVWTRGDRFWVEMHRTGNDAAFVWGRGENGSLWAVLDSHRGVRVAADQASRALALVADVYSLNVDTLLDDVLHDCVLVEGPNEADSKLTRVVHAQPRSARTRLWLGEATLEIDTEARVLRRLIIDRNRFGVPFAKVTFTLAETRPADDASYRLEGRLAQPYRIFEGNIEPRVKFELLARWLGAGGGALLPMNRSPRPNQKSKRDIQQEMPGPSNSKMSTVWLTLLCPCRTRRRACCCFCCRTARCATPMRPEIQRISRDYEPKGVSVFVVHADPDVTAAEAKKHAKDYQLPGPVLLDPTHVLVKWTGATMAPEAAVVGPDGKVLYLGRIDDLFVDYGKRRVESKKHDLRNALDAVLAGKVVPGPTGKPIGCHLPVVQK